jgi:hypothetical protein
LPAIAAGIGKFGLAAFNVVQAIFENLARVRCLVLAQVRKVDLKPCTVAFRPISAFKSFSMVLFEQVWPRFNPGKTSLLSMPVARISRRMARIVSVNGMSASKVFFMTLPGMTHRPRFQSI